MSAYSLPKDGVPETGSRPASGRAEAWLAGGGLAALAAAEAVTVRFDRGAGLALYALLLVALLFLSAHGAGREHLRRLSLGLAPVALLRVIGLGLPQSFLPPILNIAAVALPLALGVVIALRRSEAPAADLGLDPAPGPGVWLWYSLLALTGITLGAAEVAVLGKAPALPVVLPLGAVAAAAVLALGVGLLEELIFRGLLLHAAQAALGGPAAVIYVALFGALLQLGTGSFGQVALAFGLGLWFGWATLRSKTLYPAALAHALAVVVAYVILPLAAR